MAKPPDSPPGVAGIGEQVARPAAPPAYDPRPELARLSADLNQLQLCVRQIAEVNAIENVLCRGFAELREGLDGLRQGPDRAPLTSDATCRLGDLRQALLSPDWSGATTLPVHDLPVQFIGADAPSAPADYGQAPLFRSSSGDRAGYGTGSSDQQPYGDQQGSAS